MSSVSLTDFDFVQLFVITALIICGAVIIYKSLLTKAKVSNELNIPTFSDETDWNAVETQKKLTDAFETYGCCYYKMSDADQKLYNAIYPQVVEMFQRTITDEKFAKSLPDLRKYQSSSINYGYLDSYKKLSQCRAFVIPFELFENNVNFMADEHNPFVGNVKLETYANNMAKHCKMFINKILLSYLNKNELKLDAVEQAERLTGKNPQKHLRLNYYDPLVSQDTKHSEDIYGVKPHSDHGFITFLKPSTSGFQIQFNDKWINVPYYEDRFCVNIGKALSTTTNGQFKAVRHTVPVVNDGPRVSLAFFYDPDLSGMLYQYQRDGTLKELKDFTTYFYGDGAAMKSFKRYD